MVPSGVITLLSDFGLADGYVAAMKGMLLRLAPGVSLVDVTHIVPRHDVVSGGFVLASAAPFFPVGTIHLAVVDPGVGSSRSAVAIATSSAWFVGPDNGLLWRAAGGDLVEVVEIQTIPGFDGARSTTFHGRDVFAPAAAHLARGGPLRELGPDHPGLARLELPQPDIESGTVTGEVLHIDHFGNVITNIAGDDVPRGSGVLVTFIGGTRISDLVQCYADAAPGALSALIGSEGLLEIAVVEGSAVARLGVGRGDRVVVSRSS
jgi:S-adenosylmethionine hydrolase